jgi:predicted regulator of Ras-like GTPase activity (Roadblock/LC7/MglB family)
MPLSGNLKEMSLANLIQVNCQEMRSARIVVTHGNQNGEVYLSDGQVIHSTLGNLIGREAVYEMLSWEDGTFVFDRDVHVSDKTITTHWNELILEGMMQATERAARRSKQVKIKADTLGKLRAIEGVTGVVISASDGIVLDTDIPGSDGEQEAAVAVFIGSAADQLGQTMNLNTFSHGVVNTGGKRLLVLEQTERYLGLLLAEKTSPAVIASSANQILKQAAS